MSNTTPTPEPIYSTEHVTYGSEPPTQRRRKFLIPTLWAGSVILTAAVAAGVAPYAGPTAQATNTSTPSTCVDALERAETVIGLAGDGALIAADMFMAVTDSDYIELNRQSDKLDTVTRQLKQEEPKYRSARERCLSGSSG